MKRLIAACILLAFIIGIGCADGFTVTNSVKEYKAQIENCKRLYKTGDFKSAADCAESLKEEWHKTAKVISVFTNHRQLDDINALLSTLPEAIGEKNDFQFFSTVEQIRYALEMIYREQSFTLENFY